ncbi:MAG TPA: branched-chain amino acid aminotransferase [Candidatus Kapabacteria bacterium]|nr:branched-chain amino acid aminotransferase [Candidatus Kapabacteria bacterium]
MKIRLTRSNQPRPSTNSSELGFGRYFADHMFLMDFSSEKGWHDARIVPYGSLGLEPANLTLHYGQSIFEGLKAYRWADGSVKLFRPHDHAERFVRSARRLCMPEFDPEFIVDSWKALVHIDRDWVPSQPGTSLYLRPTVIAADNMLGVRPAAHYLMNVITSPVGSYYSRGASPTRILVENQYTRASAGGLGEAKTAANYAASLLAAERAKKLGFDQVLWLDAKEHRYVEEVGTMNIFFVIDGVLVTPPLGGTILDGITRRTVLQLAKEWGIPHEERRLTIDEIVEASHRGTLEEVFGSGTAATISPVGELNYNDEAITITEKEGSLRKRFFDAIIGICYGTQPDNHGWIEPVEDSALDVLEEELVDGAGFLNRSGHGEPFRAFDVP